MKELDAIKARRDALAAEVAQKRSAVGGLEAEVGRLRAVTQKVQQQFGINPQPEQAQPAAAGAGAPAQQTMVAG